MVGIPPIKMVMNEGLFMTLLYQHYPICSINWHTKRGHLQTGKPFRRSPRDCDVCWSWCVWFSSLLGEKKTVIDQEYQETQSTFLQFCFGLLEPCDDFIYLTKINLGGMNLASTPHRWFLLMGEIWEIEPLIQVNCCQAILYYFYIYIYIGYIIYSSFFLISYIYIYT